MDYTAAIQFMAIGAAVLMCLIALTNVFTQVIKKIINRDNCPAQVVVFIIAEILTILAMVIICSIFSVQILWYFWILAVITGVLVCYGAIFGYDNLYQQIGTAAKAIIEALFNKGE